MTEQEYIRELSARCSKDGGASLETIALADEAIRVFPRSCELWIMRGDLIQLGPESCPHPLEEVLASYQRAIEISPECAEAWEEVGHYYDAIMDDEATAERYFREAARLRGAAHPSSGANAASPRRSL